MIRRGSPEQVCLPFARPSPDNAALVKLVHTSDWHLGRMLHGVSLLEDQRELLGRFVAQMEALKPDAIIIAGDVYDRAVPPKDAVALLDHTLGELALRLSIPTLLIAGNHDSAERLGFGSDMLRAAGLYVAGPVCEVPQVVTLGAGATTVEVALIPFAAPEVVRSVLQDETVRTHEQALRLLCARALACCEGKGTKVAVSHAFVVGGEESDSERVLSVGGSGAVPTGVFDGFDYVALGHLHRPQRVGSEGGPHVRYSGSLMKYSFSEVDHDKGYSVVHIGSPGEPRVEHCTLRAQRDLRVIEGALEQLIEAGQDDADREDYVLARVTDRGQLFDAMARLRSSYPNALHVERPAHEALDNPGHEKIDLEQQNPLELFRLFYSHMTGGEGLNEAQEQVVHEAVRLALESGDGA